MFIYVDCSCTITYGVKFYLFYGNGIDSDFFAICTYFYDAIYPEFDIYIFLIFVKYKLWVTIILKPSHTFVLYILKEFFT